MEQSNLCDVFEMLTERLSNVEQQQKDLQDIWKTRDLTCPKGTVISGATYGNNGNLTIRKYFRPIDLRERWYSSFNLVIQAPLFGSFVVPGGGWLKTQEGVRVMKALVEHGVMTEVQREWIMGRYEEKLGSVGEKGKVMCGDIEWPESQRDKMAKQKTLSVDHVVFMEYAKLKFPYIITIGEDREDILIDLAMFGEHNGKALKVTFDHIFNFLRGFIELVRSCRAPGSMEHREVEFLCAPEDPWRVWSIDSCYTDLALWVIHEDQELFDKAWKGMKRSDKLKFMSVLEETMYNNLAEYFSENNLRVETVGIVMQYHGGNAHANANQDHAQHDEIAD